jgi:6,7-dimethyl-8-ribityllumazine synthase
MPHIEIEGALQGEGLRVAVAVARFNSFITDRLLGGALDGLRRHGVADGDTTVVRVPGAWELPVVVKALADSGKYDAVICLGAVIRGDTPHFDYVAGEAAKGIGQVMLHTGVPVAFGVLTTNTLEQAIDRAGAKSGNKGFDAAATVIEMASVLRALQMLYECEMRKIGPEDAMRDYFHTLYTEENEVMPEPDAFMEQMLFGAYAEMEYLDAVITRRSDNWKLERMPVVDRNLLRLAAWELLRTETPPAVVIDQAIELARRFSGDESARFVNGVLDALRKGEEMSKGPA